MENGRKKILGLHASELGMSHFLAPGTLLFGPLRPPRVIFGFPFLNVWKNVQQMWTRVGKLDRIIHNIQNFTRSKTGINSDLSRQSGL